MSVKISIGQQPCPWVETKVKWPKDHKAVLTVGFRKGATQRMRIRPAHRVGGGWVMYATTTLSQTNYVPVLWLPAERAVDLGRTLKAAVWVEKHVGVYKVSQHELWMQQFYQAWNEQPWA